MEKGKYTAQAKYIKKTIRRFVINLNMNTDRELIEHMENQKNIQGYIKQLIKADIEQESKSN